MHQTIRKCEYVFPLTALFHLFCSFRGSEHLMFFNSFLCVPCLLQIALSLISLTSFVNVTKCILSDLPGRADDTIIFTPEVSMVCGFRGGGGSGIYYLFATRCFYACIYKVDIKHYANTDTHNVVCLY